MAGYWSCLLSEAAAGSTLRDAGTGKDAGTSLAAGDGSLTERMQLFFVDSADSNYHASLSPDAAETAFAQFHRSGPSHSVEYSVVLRIVGFVPKVKYQAPHYRS